MRLAVPDALSAALDLLEPMTHDGMDIEPGLRARLICGTKREDRAAIDLGDISVHRTPGGMH
jgi:hypothetical protein